MDPNQKVKCKSPGLARKLEARNSKSETIMNVQIGNFQNESKTHENRSNSAESATKRGKIERKIETNLKKQSQFISY